MVSARQGVTDLTIVIRASCARTDGVVRKDPSELVTGWTSGSWGGEDGMPGRGNSRCRVLRWVHFGNCGYVTSGSGSWRTFTLQNVDM